MSIFVETIKSIIMDKIIYEKARMIKCRISDLNMNLDTIESLRKKYKDDQILELTLMSYHGKIYNEIQSLEKEFDKL